MSYWGKHPDWQRLSSPEKAAAMALLEADQVGGKIDTESARNALGAMINRAARDNVDIGEHVSGKIYQPTIEPAQFARLSRIVGSPEHKQLMAMYEGRVSGREPDWVQGATHFLAPEKVMLSLEAQDPAKYRSWRQWTGFDDKTGEYRGVTLRDRSHAFLAPEGAFSAKFGDPAASAPAGPVPAKTEAAAVAMQPPATPAPSAAPSPGGGWLTEIQGSQPTPAAPEATGGWLASLGDVLDPAGEPQKRPRQQDQAADAPDMSAPKMQRGRVDMKRMAAILQSRSRLGS